MRFLDVLLGFGRDGLRARAQRGRAGERQWRGGTRGLRALICYNTYISGPARSVEYVSRSLRRRTRLLSAAIRPSDAEASALSIAPLLDHFAVFQRKMADGVGVAVADQQFVADDKRAERIAEAGPLGEELAIGSEHLNAVVATIGDKDAPVAIDRDAVSSGKFARPCGCSSPFFPTRRIKVPSFLR